MIEIEGIEELQEMLAAGSDEWQEMQSKIDELDKQIEATRNQIGEQDRAIVQHLRLVEYARARLHACEDEHTQAQSYLKVCHEVHRQSALKTASEAKKKLETEQKALAKLEKDDSAQAKKAEREAALAKLRREKESYQGQIGMVKQSHSTLAKELAQRTCHDLEDTFEQKQRRVEDLRSQLLNAEMDLHQFHGEAVQQLSSHPEVAHNFANLMPPSEATSRVIEACLLYLTTLLQAHRDAEFDTLDTPELKRFHNPYTASEESLLPLLGIHPERLAGMKRYANEVDIVRGQQQRLQTILEQYKAHLSARR